MFEGWGAGGAEECARGGGQVDGRSRGAGDACTVPGKDDPPR